MSALDPLVTPPPRDVEPKTMLGIASPTNPPTAGERVLFVALYAVRIFAFAFVCGLSFAVCAGHF